MTSRDAVIGFRSQATAAESFNGLLGEAAGRIVQELYLHARTRVAAAGTQRCLAWGR